MFELPSPLARVKSEVHMSQMKPRNSKKENDKKSSLAIPNIAIVVGRNADDHTN